MAGYREKNRERMNAYQRDWRQRNIERVRQSEREWQARFTKTRRYGLGDGDYEAIFEHQGNACALCGVQESLRFSVDHDHEANTVRGILCNQCNRGLGMLGDTAEALRHAVAYLEETR